MESIEFNDLDGLIDELLDQFYSLADKREQTNAETESDFEEELQEDEKANKSIAAKKGRDDKYG